MDADYSTRSIDRLILIRIRRRIRKSKKAGFDIDPGAMPKPAFVDDSTTRWIGLMPTHRPGEAERRLFRARSR
jgi:hypothetical protein